MILLLLEKIITRQFTPNYQSRINRFLKQFSDTQEMIYLKMHSRSIGKRFGFMLKINGLA